MSLASAQDQSAKTILLTGVTRGLGRAMLEEFARRGHVVLGCGRARSLVQELKGLFAEPHDIAAVDVASDGEVAAWAKRLRLAHGPPDFIINNAAIINRNAPLWNVSADEFSRVIDVNIKGVANVIRHFLPAMIRCQSGVIVNFSSGWGRSVDAEVAPYCATKWAIEGLTQALAQELPSGMAAIPLNPGIINTDMLQSCFGASAESYSSPKTWAQRAVPFILRINAEDNGRSLTVPA
ncbi:MAG: SDR family oxidoreductase [Verrucomicrobiota bacterium]